LKLPSFENWNGAAMSSSPREWLWNGDEDVATPFLAGSVSRCALCAGAPTGVIACSVDVDVRRQLFENSPWVCLVTSLATAWNWELATGDWELSLALPRDLVSDG
jgi:hypothetical protein